MHKQIFIGGTGRSGTSICYDFLKSHSEIYAFGIELRFLIDYRGLMNVVDALSSNFSTVQAREALWHFEKMMKHDLVDSKKPPYIGLDISKFFGVQHYQQAIDEFLENLTDSKWLGTDYQVEPNFWNRHFSGICRISEKILSLIHKFYRKFYGKSCPILKLWPKRVMCDAKYFMDRKEIVDISSKFVDSLFCEAAKKNEKIHWCEKTPHNILHMDFLFELFPNNYFIHMMRGPRGVAQSYVNQVWASKDLEIVSLSLKKMYNRFFLLKESMDMSRFNYLEMKLEECATDNKVFENKICNFLGIEKRFVDPPKLSPGKVDYWKVKMGKKDRQTIEKILGPEIERLGYSL